jgi:hypothetical protein
MNGLKQLFRIIGNSVKKVTSFIKKYGKRIFPFLVVLFAVLITFVMIYNVVYNRPFFRTRLIAFDTHKISQTLKEIDSCCNILSVRSQRNTIDFLTVRSFVSSEIGCLNLAYPQQWKGPYFRDNPSIKGRVYEIVKAKDGNYVIPGHGVVLPNGLMMGKDVVITKNVSVDAMLQKGGDLNYKGIELGKRLDFEIGDWDFPKKSKKKMQDWHNSIEEINDALPFANNEKQQMSD